MTKRHTSTEWLHFNKLVNGGMSGDEAYEKAYGPLPYYEDDDDDENAFRHNTTEGERAAFIKDHSDTPHTITPPDERKYLELKEYARLITAGVGSVEAYAAAKALHMPDTYRTLHNNNDTV